jgi:MYXO-CTERM domain-containing protein
MILILILAFSQPVQAGDFIASVGAEKTLGPGGGWVRVFPDAQSDGWHFLWAAGGDYSLLPMSADLEVEDFDRRSLTGRTDLIDHAITRCPSGGYLHVASANQQSHNDSAYAFRYDDDFNLLASAVLEEQEPARLHNDLPVLCTPSLMATAFMGANFGGMYLSLIAEDASQQELIELPASVPKTEGGSFWVDPESGEIVVIGKSGQGSSFQLVGLDTDYQVAWSSEFQPLSDSSLRPYWPQALLKVKDHFLLAFMARNDQDGWESDWGNVFLAVLDSEFNHLETTPISNYSPPEGAQRPGLVRRGTQVLLTVDRNVQPQLFEIQLKPEAFGLGEGDETGGQWDTGDGPTEEPPGGCGCSVSPAPKDAVGLFALFGGLLIRRRRA